MKQSPEDLEKLIHQALRSTPEFRAPRSLESRVLAAIEARAALPWWRQSFVRWPMSARIAFILVSAGLAKVAIMAVVWIMAGFDQSQLASAFSEPVALFDSVSTFFGRVGDLGSSLYRSIPPLWIYGGLAIIGTLYATLFGLSAAAYRAFVSSR